jgi:pyruvate formate lyase activating enzyme
MSARVEELKSLPVVKESPLYERVRGDRVRCLVCARGCSIPEGGRGFCRTRVNVGGRLYTIVYGDLSAVESRPIESWARLGLSL